MLRDRTCTCRPALLCEPFYASVDHCFGRKLDHILRIHTCMAFLLCAFWSGVWDAKTRDWECQDDFKSNNHAIWRKLCTHFIRVKSHWASFTLERLYTLVNGSDVFLERTSLCECWSANITCVRLQSRMRSYVRVQARYKKKKKVMKCSDSRHQFLTFAAKLSRAKMALEFLKVLVTFHMLPKVWGIVEGFSAFRAKKRFVRCVRPQMVLERRWLLES